MTGRLGAKLKAMSPMVADSRQRGDTEADPQTLKELGRQGELAEHGQRVDDEVHAGEQLNALGAVADGLANDAGLLQVEECADQVGEQHPQRDLAQIGRLQRALRASEERASGRGVGDGRRFVFADVPPQCHGAGNGEGEKHG